MLNCTFANSTTTISQFFIAHKSTVKKEECFEKTKLTNKIFTATSLGCLNLRGTVKG